MDARTREALLWASGCAAIASLLIGLAKDDPIGLWLGGMNAFYWVLWLVTPKV